LKADDSQITPVAAAIEYITGPLIDPLIFHRDQGLTA
jgi:hypothetical protein